MPKLDVYSTSHKKLAPMTVSRQIFAAKLNPLLMAQAVRIYLANQRQATAKTKRRGEIKVSKKKVWRQKGTGRARHGSRNAPIFVGGAKAHGPTGRENYSLRFPQKMRRLSLFSSLTTKFQQKQIYVIDGLAKLEPKTRHFDQVFKRFFPSPKKILLLLDQPQPKLKRATRNLNYISFSLAQQLTTYKVLQYQSLVFTKEAIKALEKHYAH